MENKEIINQIQRLIDTLYSNTKVSKEQTKEDLKEIIEYCELQIDGLGATK